jgi:hypothetical protein
MKKIQDKETKNRVIMKRTMDKARIERRKRRKSYFKKSRIIIFFIVASLLVAGFVVGKNFIHKLKN